MGYIEELRKIVGTRPLILAGVGVAVIDGYGRILLQKRRDGLWGVPGGLLELGESTEEAARREVLEETGLEIGELELIDVFSGQKYFVRLPNGDQYYPVTIVYRTRDIRGGELREDGEESLEVKFFFLHELPNELSPLFQDLVEHYFGS
ncbi:NUDIX hydrolase [Anoxybacillus geothermalis]|uniref:NUDIX hydrolase n=1 Tax=Geobacillus TaxID=129337 RepID=UPI000C28300C|nr:MULTISPECIES: NUDIX hydrolase [Geobacillus]MDF9297288.1 NUDIX hydrolase [Geobacillus stearothermophilus]MED4925319.1 NUDIX hydrolase [Anoxybacillus geothermalis]MED5075446.1 NUDIX hydrolase [Anoxybacillus geothermalis]PJW17924.1 DNA mismatch repair protein MutT [Geobacillus sp. WSUCF-018B]